MHTPAAAARSMAEDNDASRHDMQSASWLRRKIDALVTQRWFEMITGSIITVNLVIVILETDDEAADGSRADVFAVLNYIFLSMYSAELLAKLYAYRVNFFFEGWNCMDFFIVLLDLALLVIGSWVDEAPSLNFLRIFRLIRLLRAFRMASLFPELNLLLKGFFGAMRAIFWGVLMVCLLLAVWSILAVKLIHPINQEVTSKGIYTRSGCERCPDAFSSVWKSCLTFFQQAVAGDSWGTVSLPIIDEAWWTAFFFLAVLVSVSLAMLNLILAVICEAAIEARHQSFQDDQQRRVEQMASHRQRMLNLCIAMDQDKSGSLTYPEFKSGWDTSQEFVETLRDMDIDQNDMQMIFRILDIDGSGDVHYKEFVEQLHMLKMNESRLILFTMMDFRIKFEERWKSLSQHMDQLMQHVSVEEGCGGLDAAATQLSAPAAPPSASKCAQPLATWRQPNFWHHPEAGPQLLHLAAAEQATAETTTLDKDAPHPAAIVPGGADNFRLDEVARGLASSSPTLASSCESLHPATIRSCFNI